MTTCPECKSPNDGHSSVTNDDTQPEDGDLSICLYCGTPSLYVVTNGKTTVRGLTAKETAEIMDLPEVKKAYAAIRHAHQRRDG